MATTQGKIELSEKKHSLNNASSLSLPEGNLKGSVYQHREVSLCTLSLWCLNERKTNLTQASKVFELQLLGCVSMCACTSKLVYPRKIEEPSAVRLFSLLCPLSLVCREPCVNTLIDSIFVRM